MPIYGKCSADDAWSSDTTQNDVSTSSKFIREESKPKGKQLDLKPQHIGGTEKTKKQNKKW
jgi:hypothetical protein